MLAREGMWYTFLSIFFSDFVWGEDFALFFVGEFFWTILQGFCVSLFLEEVNADGGLCKGAGGDFHFCQYFLRLKNITLK